jgi:hypothetical protein
MAQEKKNFIVNYDLHKDNLFKKYFQLTNETRKLRYSLTRIENYLQRELTVADFKEKKLPKIEDIENLVENWGAKTIDFIKFYLKEENLDKLILDNQHLAKKKEETFIIKNEETFIIKNEDIVEDYKFHKKNSARIYFNKNSEKKGNHSVITRIENFIGRKITIEDLKEKKINLSSKLKGIGKKCLDFIEFYSINSNLNNLLLSNERYKKKIINPEISHKQIEQIIIEDIENLFQDLTERKKFFFQHYFGYKKESLTLDNIAIEYSKLHNGPQLERERIRQVMEEIKPEIYEKKTIADEDLIKFLKVNETQSFHTIFPNLELFFTKTVKHKAKDIIRDRLLEFLECYAGVPDDTFFTPEKAIKEFDHRLLLDIFSRVPSPIKLEDFILEIMEIYGYVENIAKSTVSFMKTNNLIKLLDNKVYPINLNSVEEAAHIALKHPNGIFWKDIYLIMNNSFTENKFNLNRKQATVNINDNPSLWLSSKGVYKHINYLKFKKESNFILDNVNKIFKKNKIKTAKIVEIYKIFIKIEIQSLRNISYYEFRAIIKYYGESKGIFYIGKSNTDTISISKNFDYITNKSNIFKVIFNSDNALSEDAISQMISKKNLGKKNIIVSHYCDQLLEEKKIIKVGPKTWYEADRGLKMCNLDLIKNEIIEIFKTLQVVSIVYFTKLVNQKLNYAFSFYYYDSILRFLSSENKFFYNNSFISTEDKIYNLQIIYKNFFSKKSNPDESLNHLFKKGIAISKGQINNFYYSQQYSKL